MRTVKVPLGTRSYSIVIGRRVADRRVETRHQGFRLFHVCARPNRRQWVREACEGPKGKNLHAEGEPRGWTLDCRGLPCRPGGHRDAREPGRLFDDDFRYAIVQVLTAFGRVGDQQRTLPSGPTRTAWATRVQLNPNGQVETRMTRGLSVSTPVAAKSSTFLVTIVNSLESAVPR